MEVLLDREPAFLFRSLPKWATSGAAALMGIGVTYASWLVTGQYHEASLPRVR